MTSLVFWFHTYYEGLIFPCSPSVKRKIDVYSVVSFIHDAHIKFQKKKKAMHNLTANYNITVII